MKQAHRNWILTLLLAILFSTGQAQETLPYIADGLLDSTHIETLGLRVCPAVKTVTIFSPTDETMHYANGVVMTAFKIHSSACGNAPKQMKMLLKHPSS